MGGKSRKKCLKYLISLCTMVYVVACQWSITESCSGQAIFRPCLFMKVGELVHIVNALMCTFIYRSQPTGFKPFSHAKTSTTRLTPMELTFIS